MPKSFTGWGQWIRNFLLLLITIIGYLLKLGIDDVRSSVKSTSEALHAQAIEIKGLTDGQAVWLTMIPKLQGADEEMRVRQDKAERKLDNHEYRLESLEKRTNIRPP